MRLIGTNYTQDDTTEVSFTSQSPYHPVTNIKHEHRAKEWRSTGHFKITSSNNQINLDSTPYTIPEGSYTQTQLLAELNELNPAAQFSYNFNTYKFSVETTVTITGNLLVLMGFSSTVSADATAPLRKLHTSEHVTFDLKTTEDINSVVLLWGKGAYKLSASAEVRLKASATSNFSTVGVDVLLTLNNQYEIASHYFEGNQSFRFWRIEITDPQNANGYVNLGVVVLGKSEDNLDMPEIGWSFSTTDASDITTTAFGQTYVDEYPTLNELNLDFNFINDVTSKAFIDLYQQIGTKKPVFVAIDPAGSTFDKDLFCIYGRFQKQLQLNNVIYKTFQTALTITESN